MPLAMDATHVSVYAAAAGALSHWTYFMHREHHVQAPTLVRLALLIPVLALISAWQFTDLGLLQAAKYTALAVISYFTALWTSIVVYRVVFHRLRSFPGPFMFSVSKLWHVYKLAPRSDNYVQLDELHKKYGDFVRTGPSEITIFDPEAVPILLGPGTRCTKAPWYDANLPYISMHTLRDKSAHDKRRRIWDRGFGAKALRQYEDRVLGYSKELAHQISNLNGKIINAAEWFHYYSFDVMGDIAFGKSFDLLKTGKTHFALEILREGMKPFGVLTPVPWMFCILTSIPGLSAGFKTFVAWAAEQVKERKKLLRDDRQIEMEVPDVMSWLIDATAKAEESQRRAEEDLLESDSRLIIVAGSDTTAAALTYTFYHLAKDPSQVETLRKEIKPFQGSDGEFNVKDLQSADHLNGIINEALRLHPPVPSGTLRVTPPEGITVRGTFIPGDTTVISPPWTVGRLESCFERASEFIPERWYSKPEMVKNKAAFAPFSLGPYSCVGKQLALMELRTVVTLLVSQFDVRFAPGEDGTHLLRDSKDFFTVSLSDLHLIFTPRVVA